MLVKTFQSASMAEAIRMVKAELGSDAMILSTKKEKSGGILGFFSKPVYRVTAAIDPARNNPPPPPAAAAPYRESEPQRTAKEDLENSMLAPLARELRELRERVDALSRQPEAAQENMEETQSESPGEGGLNLKNIPRGDIDELKKLLLNTLSKGKDGSARTIQWPSAEKELQPENTEQPGKATDDFPLGRELSNSGISSEWVGAIVEAMKMLPEDGASHTAKNRLGNAFGKLVKFSGALKMRKNSPRIIALVGPTGVGKTTTTAKLAAMHALNKGSKVALITMDIFRVGAVEQLKTYSRIMGIPLEVASTPLELEKAVERYSDYDLIMIDTAGRSHKDQEKLSEMKNFFEDKFPMEVYLCLSATTKDRELEEILHRFSIFQIGKIVFTKIDESESCGNMVNLLMKNNLQVAYFTTGQRVPEDIEVATPAKLADMILKGAQHECGNA